MTKSIITLFVGCFLTFSLQAQSLRAYENAAAKAAAVKDYTGALGYYKIILEDAGNKEIGNYFKAAEAARMARDYKYAEAYYSYVIDNRSGNEFAEAEYWLADAQKYLGKYDASKKNFEAYAGRKSIGNKSLAKRASAEAENAEWAIGIVAQKDDTDIIHLDDNINSGYSEFSPFMMEDQLYYSSIRYFGAEEEKGMPLAKIMTSENKTYGVTLKGNINLDLQHVSNPSLTENGERLYYTICEEKEQLIRRCDIYYRDRNGDDWDAPIKLPESINSKNANNTHPYEGMTTTGERFLLFASNSSGGEGGMDIYKSDIDGNGEFGQPQNLKSLNTEGNEVTPFYHKRSRTLYYSTDGKNSLGGLDIYKSKMNAGNWIAAEHAGYPLNSSYDDTYLKLNERGDQGYFSSNRPGAYCLDSTLNCACPDIYETNRPVVDLIVRTYNAITKEPLTGTEVTLLPKSYDPESQMNLDNNEYYFGLDFENGYDIKGSKEGYTYDTAEAETFGDRTSRTLEKELFLAPMVDLSALVFDQRTGEPLNGATVELFILGEDGAIEKRIEIDKNNFEFPLDWLQRYRVVASKDGYQPDEVTVMTDGIPVVPTSLTKNLFLCRLPFAQYPFLAMYFDNDYPKCEGQGPRDPDYLKCTGIANLTANNDYEATYLMYSTADRRQNFIDAFNTEMEKQELRDFFDKVDEGYVRLKQFAGELERLYVEDKFLGSAVVTIKGFASPRDDEAYNIDLTKRRVNSMIQYLAKYKDGILVPYLPKYENGELTNLSAEPRIEINTEPYGEETAKGGSEDLNNLKASIYAVDASEERRVEIIRFVKMIDGKLCPEYEQK